MQSSFFKELNTLNFGKYLIKSFLRDLVNHIYHLIKIQVGIKPSFPKIHACPDTESNL
jgi:hypothetical protein